MTSTSPLDRLGLPAMPFAQLIDLDVTRVEAGLVEGEMPVRPDLCTLGGILHGGAIMTLADCLGAIGAFVNLDGKASGTATIASQTHFLGPARSGGKVIGVATPLHRGRRTQVWQTSIATPEGRLVAVVTQTQMTRGA